MNPTLLAWLILSKIRERKLKEAKKKGLLGFGWNRHGRLIPIRRAHTIEEVFGN